MDFLHSLNTDQVKTDRPEFKAGDTLDVHIRIVEGNKERVQVFSGVVIQVKGTGVGKTFTIRKISNGIGVEKILPLNSPFIDKIVKVKEGKVRQARIYYFRERRGKSARIKEVKKGK
ncbi:MAG: 50S ribosomal protein L19 [Candidatus Delongbacteria bacterium]|jgi:large subunit ribosomal protein L19|nr:50S ribosomal protein L19 [Candidatus Delongbacteria bacterium]MDY0017198.1 50S ribosomal protein L19 [Candidatus Delongbacteria bacterium]